MSRNYFDTPTADRGLVLLDVDVLTRPPEHAPTLAEAIAAICSGHGDAS